MSGISSPVNAEMAVFRDGSKPAYSFGLSPISKLFEMRGAELNGMFLAALTVQGF